MALDFEAVIVKQPIQIARSSPTDGSIVQLRTDPIS